MILRNVHLPVDCNIAAYPENFADPPFGGSGTRPEVATYSGL